MSSIELSLKQDKSAKFSFQKLMIHIQKNLIIWIPVAMALGLIYGYMFDASVLKGFILPATFIMVYPMMVTLNIKKLMAKGGTKLLSITQFFNFLIIPFIGFGVGLIFFKDNLLLRIGLLLITLIPTSGMTITWTGIAKGNVNEAIRMTVSGLIMGAVLTPVYLKVLLGTAIDLPMVKIFSQIAIVVFIPLVIGYITQRLLVNKHGQEKFQKEIKMKFPPLSSLGVLFMVFIAMALKAKGILANPIILLKLIVPVIIMYSIIFLIGTLSAKVLFPYQDAVAMVYGSAMRNLSIALAIAMTVFKTNGSEIALIIAVAFIVQVQFAVWYSKLSKKILA